MRVGRVQYMQESQLMRIHYTSDAKSPAGLNDDGGGGGGGVWLAMTLPAVVVVFLGYLARVRWMLVRLGVHCTNSRLLCLEKLS